MGTNFKTAAKAGLVLGLLLLVVGLNSEFLRSGIQRADEVVVKGKVNVSGQSYPAGVVTSGNGNGVAVSGGNRRTETRTRNSRVTGGGTDVSKGGDVSGQGPLQNVRVPGFENRSMQVPLGTVEEVAVYNMLGIKLASSLDNESEQSFFGSGQGVFFLSVVYDNGLRHMQKIASLQ